MASHLLLFDDSVKVLKSNQSFLVLKTMVKIEIKQKFEFGSLRFYKVIYFPFHTKILTSHWLLGNRTFLLLSNEV